MTPINSLEILANILQRLSLPAIADEGQLSHRVIAEHLQNIQAALPPPDTETQKEQPC